MPGDNAQSRTDKVSRRIHAAPADVYAAFTDGERLMRWLPPKNMSGKALEYDFREGGSYRIELRYEGDEGKGKTSANSDISKGRFLSLVPAREIRQSVEFETRDPAMAESMTITWTFEPVLQGTDATVTAQCVPAGISEDDHIKGLTSSLENLASFVELG